MNFQCKANRFHMLIIPLLILLFQACSSGSRPPVIQSNDEYIKAKIEQSLTEISRRVVKSDYRLLLCYPDYEETFLTSDMGAYMYRLFSEVMESHPKLRQKRRWENLAVLTSTLSLTEDLYQFDGVMNIKYFPQDTGVRFDVDLLDFHFLESFANSSFFAESSKLTGTEILPGNFDIYESIINPDNYPEMKPGFDTYIIPVQGYRIPFKVNHKLELYYVGNQRNYIRVIMTDTSGDVWQVFPHFQSWEHQINPGQIMSIPDGQDFILSESGSYVVKLLYSENSCIETGEQLNRQGSFINLGNVNDNPDIWTEFDSCTQDESTEISVIEFPFSVID